jgi:predicted thioesterase
VTDVLRMVGYQRRFLAFEVEARAGDLVLGRRKVYRAIIEPQTFDARATARTDERRCSPC